MKRSMAKHPPTRVAVRRVPPATYLKDDRGAILPIDYSTAEELLHVGIVALFRRDGRVITVSPGLRSR